MGILKLLVLDCDGVLFDSKQANTYFYNYILERVGRPPMTPEEIEFVHMHSVNECLAYLFRDIPEKLELAKNIQKEISYSLFFDYLVMEKGLKDFLSWAKNYLYIALCTNRTTSTYPLLSHFNLTEYFDYVMSAAIIPKNDPRALLQILEHFKVKPEETLYVGDSKVDETLCKTCKVPLVAFKNKELEADYYVENFYELKELLISKFSFSKRS
ncbi:HAD family hydrolase [Thermodesulfobacterium sp. TA1]|uniref:HAD family hydrolase n=1 Tax=Thermodesulfobacterium sp. TA1 TaxID=2234087 RepID=UPI001231AB9B|nr:HAD-IA family hydrolase [Thermodesulfobacterium sp. TA1]QER42537.1 HAD family hydrolase [Thermodesulfobacterium sp. TA1]